MAGGKFVIAGHLVIYNRAVIGPGDQGLRSSVLLQQTFLR